jgi:hypothetical protein
VVEVLVVAGRGISKDYREEGEMGAGRESTLGIRSDPTTYVPYIAEYHESVL